MERRFLKLLSLNWIRRRVGEPILDLADLAAQVDSAWYLEKYPDVAAAGVDPVQHFLLFGHAEGRSPSEFLDPVWYASTYPDVAEKGKSPVLHYVRHGWREGRNPGPKFDVQRYFAAYPEIAASGKDPLAII